ncbi:hypothetical protein NL676_029912 [Syzygium grande]|nr:hypothetical protein NL676_029912 [Syzygium grande]
MTRQGGKRWGGFCAALGDQLIEVKCVGWWNSRSVGSLVAWFWGATEPGCAGWRSAGLHGSCRGGAGENCGRGADGGSPGLTFPTSQSLLNRHHRATSRSGVLGNANGATSSVGRDCWPGYLFEDQIMWVLYLGELGPQAPLAVDQIGVASVG